MQSIEIKAFSADWLLCHSWLADQLLTCGLPSELVLVSDVANVDRVAKAQLSLLPQLRLYQKGALVQSMHSSDSKDIASFIRSAQAAKQGRTLPPAFQKCPAGHTLDPVKTLPPQYRDGLFQCDSCKSLKQADGRTLLHCASCNYDICSNCSVIQTA